MEAKRASRIVTNMPRMRMPTSLKCCRTSTTSFQTSMISLRRSLVSADFGARAWQSLKSKSSRIC